MLPMLPIGPMAHNIDESTHGNGEGRHTHLGGDTPPLARGYLKRSLKKVSPYPPTRLGSGAVEHVAQYEH